MMYTRPAQRPYCIIVNMDVLTLHNTVLNILTLKKINSRAVEQDLSGLNSSHELHQTAHWDSFQLQWKMVTSYAEVLILLASYKNITERLFFPSSSSPNTTAKTRILMPQHIKENWKCFTCSFVRVFWKNETRQSFSEKWNSGNTGSKLLQNWRSLYSENSWTL